MRYLKTVLSVFIIMFIVSPVFSADKYTIDTVHSTIEFSVKHLVITNVKGNFKDFSGTLMVNEKTPANSSVEVTINVSSIDTNNEDRDKHLKNSDFFDAEKYPAITFKSKQIKKKKSGYLCIGTLTMHGVSKDISIPFKATNKIKGMKGETRFGIEANLALNRKDFGMTWNKVMDGGGVVVGNEVKIELNIEAIKE